MLDDDYRPKIEVKRASAGLGLFAAEDIPRGQLIIEYTGERLRGEEADRRGGRYLFEVNDNLIIDGSGRRNMARYVNHACRPNALAEHETTEDRIYIRAKRKIRAGEEITYPYGREYVDDIIKKVGCRCQDCDGK